MRLELEKARSDSQAALLLAVRGGGGRGGGGLKQDLGGETLLAGGPVAADACGAERALERAAERIAFVEREEQSGYAEHVPEPGNRRRRRRRRRSNELRWTRTRNEEEKRKGVGTGEGDRRTRREREVGEGGGKEDLSDNCPQISAFTEQVELMQERIKDMEALLATKDGEISEVRVEEREGRLTWRTADGSD
eukprot:647109-Hanusia_phi.AAC.2